MSIFFDSAEENAKRAEAQKIAALAAKFRIPLPEDAEVVKALSRLDSTEAVPPELYSLIGAVLAFVHRVDDKLPL